MRREAAKLRDTDWRELNLTGRVRKLIVVGPLAVLAHTLFVKGTLFDGWLGLHYAFERLLAELFLSWKLLRRRD